MNELCNMRCIACNVMIEGFDYGEQVNDILVSPQHKSFPSALWGRRAGDALPVPLDRFQTPVLTLDRGALDSNLRVMADWLSTESLLMAPHGKTTMAPALWNELLAGGAWGLTFATPWQVQCARSSGIRRIMLANAVTDPAALRWLAAELAADAGFEFCSWVDSVATVDLMTSELDSVGRPLDVLVELGGADGRTGARSVEEAVSVAEAVRRSPALRLVGVAGYEGALAHDRSNSGIARVDGWLDDLVELFRLLASQGFDGDGLPIVTAGGSAYFDRVAARLRVLRGEASVIVRSGAFQIHDDGFYSGISPMGSLVGTEPFRSAMHAWVRVVSRPEPGLVLFDAGKRDLPFDEGLPVAQLVRGGDSTVLAGSTVTALNDQHGFLRLAEPFAHADTLPVGSVLRLGLSHPCTALDKWRLIPVVDDADSSSPAVIDAIETRF